MIEFALSKYLRSIPAITDLIGDRVFISRRPANYSSKKVHVTLERIATRRRYALAGEIDCAMPVVRLDIWSQGANAQREVFEVFEAIRCEISSYRGTWGDTEVLACSYQNEGVDTIFPVNRSDKWTFSYGADLRITHRQKPVSSVAGNLLYRLTSGRVLRLRSGRAFQPTIPPPRAPLHRLSSGRILVTSSGRAYQRTN